LAAIDRPLPAILVDRSDLRVIDGNHRLMAASLRGQDVIDVEFFDGSREDAFLRAVEANVGHGLPLTQADRTAAALRILKSHPNMSDRAIAKVRPVNGANGRLRVAEYIRENPAASLRQVARMAGVSPATVLDVRRRLERGEEPVPGECDAEPVGPDSLEEPAVGKQSAAQEPQSTAALAKLMRDPSLRQSELGRRLLRMFKENALGANEMSDIVASVPSHCIDLTIQLSQRNSEIWEVFAQELNRRARIVNPR
jgi:hypothetical protein